MPIQLATKRIFLICLIVSLATSAILGVMAFLGSRMGGFTEDLLATALFTSLYSLIALGCAIPFDRSHWRFVSGIGILLAITALALTIPPIWLSKLSSSEAYIKTVAVIGILGFAAGHLGLISLAQISKRVRWIQLFTLCIIAGLALLVIALIILEPRYPDQELWWRGIGILAVLSGCGTITVPVLHILLKIQRSERVETLELQMTIICPRCQLQQAVEVGHSTCQNCRLQFKIEIEEPRCDHCGYLLYQLTEPRCPECGAVFESSKISRQVADV